MIVGLCHLSPPHPRHHHNTCAPKTTRNPLPLLKCWWVVSRVIRFPRTRSSVWLIWCRVGSVLPHDGPPSERCNPYSARFLSQFEDGKISTFQPLVSLKDYPPNNQSISFWVPEVWAVIFDPPCSPPPRAAQTRSPINPSEPSPAPPPRTYVVQTGSHLPNSLSSLAAAAPSSASAMQCHILTIGSISRWWYRTICGIGSPASQTLLLMPVSAQNSKISLCLRVSNGGGGPAQTPSQPDLLQRHTALRLSSRHPMARASLTTTSTIWCGQWSLRISSKRWSCLMILRTRKQAAPARPFTSSSGICPPGYPNTGSEVTTSDGATQRPSQSNMQTCSLQLQSAIFCNHRIGRGCDF